MGLGFRVWVPSRLVVVGDTGSLFREATDRLWDVMEATWQTHNYQKLHPTHNQASS